MVPATAATADARRKFLLESVTSFVSLLFWFASAALLPPKLLEKRQWVACE